MLKIMLSTLLCLWVSGMSYAAQQESPPVWLTDPAKKYPEAQYLTAVGTGKSRKDAELNAIEVLAAVFERSIQAETKTSLYMQTEEAQRQDKTEKRRRLDTSVTSSTKLDSFVGLEIKDSWMAADGSCSVLATVNKNHALSVYRKRILNNCESIKTLVAIPPMEQGTFAAYSRFKAALEKARENERFQTYVLFLNPAALVPHDTELDVDVLQLEAARIAKTITVSVSVEGDKDEKIKASFVQFFSALGFTVTDTAATGRYTLHARLRLEEPTQQGNKVLVRYSFDASLQDQASGTIAASYTVSSREIHFTQRQAETKILAAVQKKITTEFSARFEQAIGSRF